MSTPAQRARNHLGGLVRSGAPPEQIAEQRAALKAAGLESRIRRDVASWPPLSADVRAELAILLLSGGDDAT